MAKLTARRVQTEARPGTHGDGGGLYLQIAAGGSKSWIYRYQLAGRRRSLGLGGTATVSLAEAREKAAEARRQVAAGFDPIETRPAPAPRVKAMTFADCAGAYINAHKGGWRSRKSLSAWENTLASYVHPVFGALPVSEIDVEHVMRAIEPIWQDKRETAGRVRARIEAVLDWARARGYRQTENPARWRGHLENLLPKRSKLGRGHHPALPYGEIGDFMADLRQQDGIAARALEFAILTAARTGEVLGARWGELDLAGKVWTIPAGRMKAGKEHRVPLSDTALAIVEAMARVRSSDWVFPGHQAGQPRGSMALLQGLARLGRGDLTVHGFRSSFSDWAAERTGFPCEIAEMSLAHTVGGAVERAYRRSDALDKRRQLMGQWANFCVAVPLTGEVVALRASGSR